MTKEEYNKAIKSMLKSESALSLPREKQEILVDILTGHGEIHSAGFVIAGGDGGVEKTSFLNDDEVKNTPEYQQHNERILAALYGDIPREYMYKGGEKATSKSADNIVATGNDKTQSPNIEK